MNFARAGIADELHDLLRGRAADDAVVDQHDAVAADDAGIRRMLQLDAELADALLRLDEGAPDVVIADDAELEGNVALLAEADRGGRRPKSGIGTITSAPTGASRASSMPIRLRMS